MNEQKLAEKLAYRDYQYQEALQQRTNEADISKYAPTLHEQIRESQAVLVEQTNPNRIVDEVEMALRNIQLLPDGTYKKMGNPMMNDHGINRVRFIMKSIVNQRTVLSHLEDKHIKKIIIELANDIIDDLTMNFEDYEVDKTMLDYIVDAIIFPSFMSLMSAWEQNEKNWLGKISIENISNSPKPQAPKSEGFLSKIKL